MLTTVAALENLLALEPGSLTGADLARATEAIETSSELVLLAGRSDWTLTTAPPLARSIATRAAKRDYDNPEGYVSENLGDYAYTRSADTGATGWLTCREETALARLAGRGIGSTRTPSAYGGVR